MKFPWRKHVKTFPFLKTQEPLFDLLRLHDGEPQIVEAVDDSVEESVGLMMLQ